MQNLNDLYLYVQAVDHGGFAPAGRALGIPKSKLSRRIAELEQRLGVRLIQRSSRRFHITDIGQVYYRHCQAMLVEAQAAQDAIDVVHAEPCGVVKLSCPTALLQMHVGQMLADFMQMHPKLELQLEATNRRVNVLAEGMDLAIRVRPPPLEDSDLILRVLSDRGQCIVASAELAQRFTLPQSPQDLASWPSMALGSGNEQYEWRLEHAQADTVVVRHQPRLVTTDMMALRTAALAGVGIVQLPRLTVDALIAQGQFIDLLPQWQPPREIIHLVFPSRRGLLPAVRSLIDYLAQAYAAFDED